MFPLRLPPLRERATDIPALASAFAARYARRYGRTLAPLTNSEALRLQSYAWPGNIRELQNVMERAVITAVDGRLNLDRALPETFPAPLKAPTPEDTSAPPIRTLRDLEALERDNLHRALEASAWRISGPQGAAALIGMNPSTLRSRMKSLGLKAP
ncbi:MAG: hypothetical protein JNL10_00835 [Verrucomicrobiales bacterium]|nr:hypothetical protein [Verrucomicrobiales bacterium]